MAGDGENLYVRNPAVTETTLDDDVFLVEPETGEVFYLNAITSGLWTLFSAPTSLSDAVAAYREAFPDEPAEKVAADVRGAAEDMLARALIVTFS
ncbi:MAG: PqqD family protein [Proteobacteria bacterium]|nr:PqqD family protein [Pseudomonadota bacterium]